MSAARPRVYYLITDLDWGGAEKNLVALATRLPARFELAGVGCLLAPNAAADALRAAGVTVDCFDVRSWRDLGRVGAIARRLRALRVDLVHTFLFHANLLGRCAAALAGTHRVVSSVRVAETRRWHLLLDGLTQGLIDRESAVGQAVLEHTARRARVSRRKLFRVPIGLDPADVAPPAPRLPGPPRILGVGRLHAQKRWEDLIDALAALADRDWTAQIVGEGPEREALEARIAAAGLSDRVALPGYRSPIGPVYRAADLFVLPSSWEGMPNVVLEAMAHELPVIATTVGATAELLADAPRDCGVLVPPHRPDRLTAAIAALLDDPARRAELAERAQARALSEFSVDRMIELTTRVYEELL